MLKDGDHTDQLKTDTEETILTTSTDPMIGSLLAERLQILSLIGAGGMSTVYKAKHLLLDRVVAVKVMQADKVNNNIAQRFQQEAKAATALNHPNIATVREFGVAESGDPYLVMDYVEGTSLADVINEEGSLSCERTKIIMTQVCAGLQHAHTIGVVHRDLKPANIMLSKDTNGNETAKIVDFGIAKIIQQDEHTELTKAGEIFGTPLYMSPEQGLGKPVDARSDIYSIGCLMYECLSGKPPFESSSALATLLQHTSEVPPPLRNGGDITEVVIKCLEKDPDNRYQSAEALRQALIAPPQIQKNGQGSKQGPKLRTTVMFGALALVASILLPFAMMLWPHVHALVMPSPWEKLANDANANVAQGPSNYETAKVLFNRAMAAAEMGNASDTDKERLYNNVGKFYSRSDDWDDAVKYLSQAIALNSKHAENTDTGSLQDWISEAYIFQKNFDQAAKHAQEAVRIKKKLLGDHEHTLFALFHLGQAYRGLKKYDSAESTDRDALRLAQKLYPAGDNIDSLDANEQLANVLADENKSDEAIDYYKKALQSSLLARGAQDPKTKEMRDWLISYMRTCGRESEANKIPPLQNVEILH